MDTNILWMTTENNSQGFVINNNKATIFPSLSFFLAFQPMTHMKHAWMMACDDLQINEAQTLYSSLVEATETFTLDFAAYLQEAFFFLHFTIYVWKDSHG